MRRLAVIGLGLLAVTASGTGWAGETVSGRARVLNGDTLVVGARVVGLYGVAAPGLKQTCLNAKGQSYECGAVSARALASRTKDAVVACQVRETDSYGRALAVCHKDKEDLGAWMVGEGHAVADRRARAYEANEMPAWGRRRGLWAGSFEDPTNRKRADYSRPNAVADAAARDEVH